MSPELKSSSFTVMRRDIQHAEQIDALCTDLSPGSPDSARHTPTDDTRVSVAALHAVAALKQRRIIDDLP